MEKVIKFLELLKKSIYVESEHRYSGFIKIAQKILWPEVWKILKKQFETVIPDHFDDLNKFSEIHDKLLSYENQLSDLEMMPSNINDISNFLKNIKYHYFKKNKNEFLQMVRDVLQSNDQNTVEVKDELERGGFNIFGDKKIKFNNIKENKEKSEMDDNSFKLPTCHITIQTQTIVEIAYQKMNEAVESDELNAIEAIYNVRDLFVLFRAISTLYHQDSIEFIPNRAMLFYNDCIYIAHHLLTLGHHYQSKLRPPLDSTVTFIDMVPTYRQLGQMYFKKQLRRQRDIILNDLKQINGFENLSDDNKLENTERIFRNILYQLDYLSKNWKIILANEVYLQAIGLLFNSLLEEILNEVLNIKSISNNELHQLKYLLSLLMIQSKEWFTFTMGSGKEKIVEQAPILKYVELWEKFQQLFKIFEISINQVLEGGWTKYNKFSKQELLTIFRSRFQHLPEMNHLEELLE
ncbi:Zw10-domain-containing protein [Anaeromyces robustus]|uniref:Zw10-domain-containing protein n=1 Tax=Anaeromyces robustus TaxID=1754192 RepID=A0A1Y1W4F4_9FUNG|nr:Zw10-domain-containing protein [Anaeromyces robustus]|eukprot:ORX68450.1 Zw10-domain-containing protein [Anaeromyces robustus]